jgi:hypothetical protein
MHTASRGRRLTRLVSLGAVTGLLGLTAAVPSSAAPPGAADEPSAPPGVDEIVSSSNLRQVAHLPKQAPLDTPGSYNTDWAFQGRYAYGGNYNGFTVYDISRPTAPTIAAQVLCPGAQNDVSVSGDLLFLSTDAQRTDDSCASAGSTAALPGDRWEGVKVFDISDPLTPKHITSVKTACGSHTHTLVPGKRREKALYLYVSSYTGGSSTPNCAQPHDQISIIKVPLRKPAEAAVVATPVLFPDGGFPGAPGRSATSGCHDITAYPAKDLAAGACMGDGVLFDISRRTAPRIITTVRDTANFAFWHSATFNTKASKVVFTDELGGGGSPTCNPTVGPQRGADAVCDIVGRGDDRRLVFRSYFKIPRTNTDTENCVAHNGSLIPVKGRDIMVQAWYQGGISVWDFTDSANPREIGFWERGPLSATQLVLGGSWSAYWYNGFIYSNDIAKGLDVLQIRDRRTDPARRVHVGVLNVQTQPTYRRH